VDNSLGGKETAGITAFKYDDNTFIIGVNAGVHFKMASMDASGTYVTGKYVYTKEVSSMSDLTTVIWDNAPTAASAGVT
jgi:hypothetical protein